MEPIRASATVSVPPARAFELFSEGLDSWWPREFSWSGETLQEIGIEPGEGGFAYERGPHGFLVHWGRVTTWEPPDRLVFTWQIAARALAAARPKASEVEIRFTDAGDSTRVDVEHRGWGRHGEGAREYRDGFEQAGAWPYALQRFAAAAGA